MRRYAAVLVVVVFLGGLVGFPRFAFGSVMGNKIVNSSFNEGEANWEHEATVTFEAGETHQHGNAKFIKQMITPALLQAGDVVDFRVLFRIVDESGYHYKQQFTFLQNAGRTLCRIFVNDQGAYDSLVGALIYESATEIIIRSVILSESLVPYVTCWSCGISNTSLYVADVQLWVGGYETAVGGELVTPVPESTVEAKESVIVHVHGYDTATVVINGAVLKYEQTVPENDQWTILASAFGWRARNAVSIETPDGVWWDYFFNYSTTGPVAVVFTPVTGGSYYQVPVAVIGYVKNLPEGYTAVVMNVNGVEFALSPDGAGAFSSSTSSVSRGANTVEIGYKDSGSAYHALTTVAFMYGSSPSGGGVVQGPDVTWDSTTITTALGSLWGFMRGIVSVLYEGVACFPAGMQGLLYAGLGLVIVLRVLGR